MPPSAKSLTGPKNSVSAAPVQAAQTQRDVLLDVIALFTHDLSNPLQSITVLSELALEETPPGSDEHERLQQNLVASERMRLLLQSLARFVRGVGSPQSAENTVKRALGLLAARLDKQGFVLHDETQWEGACIPPHGFDMAVLAVLMGFLAGSSEQRLRNCELMLRSQVAGRDCSLELRAQGVTRDGVRETIVLPRTTEARVHALTQASGIVFDMDASVMLRFQSVSAESP